MLCFFFNDTATTEIYTLSLHDALPICLRSLAVGGELDAARGAEVGHHPQVAPRDGRCRGATAARALARAQRSEEHTSELQSHLNLVCRPLLEKKKHVPSRTVPPRI